MSNVWPFESCVRDIVSLLADGEYAALEQRSGGVRLSAAQIAEGVLDYPYPPIVPPAHMEPAWHVVSIAVAEPPAWSVWVPLWTAQEGQSDLTLQLTVRAESATRFRVEIDNLLVP